MSGLPAGGESDVLVVADPAGVRWVVKQYRQPGWKPSDEVLEVLADLRVDESASSWASDRRLRHLVWLEDWGVDPSTGLFYEVQEFLTGGSLADGGMDGFATADLAEALALAVGAFHKSVGAHRDVKPANLLVRSEDPLVLTLADVGLARDVGDGSVRYSKRDGSAAYQAPEAAQGKVSRAGDWWAVGVMVAERALGRHPMALPDGSMPDERTLLASVAERNVPLEGIEDGRIKLLCQGLLTRDTDGRWGAAEVAEWRKGGSPPTGYAGGGSSSRSGAAPGPVRTVLFRGNDYDSPEGLAAAFAAYPIDAGRALFEQRDRVVVDDLRLMLGQAGLSEASGVFESYRSGSWEPVLLRLLGEMDPRLTPELSGQDMTPGGMAQLASDVVGAVEATPAQKDALSWVLDHDLWRLWRRLPGMGNAAAVAARLDPSIPRTLTGDWHGVGEAEARRLRSILTPLVQAWAVMLAVEPDLTAHTLVDQVDSHRSTLSQVAWWCQIADERTPASQAMAVSLVGAALRQQAEAEAAQRAHEAAEAARIMEELEERKRYWAVQARARAARAVQAYEERAAELRLRLGDVHRHLRKAKREAGYAELLVHARRLRAQAESEGLSFPAQPLLNDPTYATMDAAAKAKYVSALIWARPIS
jgi:hypothetical protein